MDNELMREAGFGGGFKTYKNLTVDNGSDISGTDATGDFVQVSFDENDTRQKDSFGKEFEGVILFSRAVLTYRDKLQTKKKVWESEEFNPLLNRKRDGAKALIPIYRLDFNGQRQKDDGGKFVVDYAFYDDLQKGKKEGVKGMDYAYTIVVYVLVLGDEKEVVKIRFAGAGRGNFFKYQQKLWKEFRAKPHEVVTKFSTYVEKEYKKYAIAFAPVLQEDGQPQKYNDPVEIENEMGELVSGAREKSMRLTPPTAQNMLNPGGATNNTTEAPSAQANILEAPTPTAQETPPIEAYEEEANSDKINIKDIPEL